jgi:outer membrane protein OmpA-like peptidoglycan-associated protein
MKPKLILFLLVIGFSYLSYAQNSDIKVNNSLSGVVILTGEGGITIGQTDYSSTKINYLGKGSIEYVLQSTSRSNLAFDLFGSMGYLSGTSTYLIPNELNTKFSLIGGGLSFITQLSDNVFPYISLGASYMWVSPRDENGNNFNPMFKIIGLNGGVGVRFMINRDWSFNVGGGAITGTEDANDDNLDGHIRGPHKDWIFTGSIGISYYIGRNKDSDGDGVYDSEDMCPNTPPGVRVDQFGCPIDSDGDGVPDDQDECPNTPKGVIVDRLGCPIDSDGDGVADYLDKCPNTPKGVEVNAEGCPLDSDGDGVPDYLDKCPDTPLRVQVDSNGCPLDSDGDGVPDYLDKCPGTPSYYKVDNNGCPLDSDHDGVPDYLDKCPNTPRGTKVDSAGCPGGFKREVSNFILGVDASFDVGKADLLPGAYKNLIVLAVTLKEHPDYRAIINGYTDSRGSEERNLILSEKRARAVADYLISQGIARTRLEIRAHGESDPVASNNTEAGRAQNRRVEIKIISIE